MSMMLILLLCGDPILLLLYGMMRYYGRESNGLLFGARVEPGWSAEPAVQAICRGFRHRLNLYTLILALIPLVLLPIPYDSIAMLLWTFWLLVAIGVQMVPFVQANHALRRWKAEQGYSKPGAGKRLVELKGLGELRCVRWLDFLWPTLVCILATAAPLWLLRGDADRWVLVGILATFLLAELIFAVAALCMDRTRITVISTDSRVNLNYNRAKRMLWRKMWLWLSWLTAALTVASAAGSGFSFDAGMSAMCWGSAVYAAALILVLVWLICAQSKLNRTYRPQMDLPAGSVDDDDCWLGGMLYYNPVDRRVNVEKRMGIGFTINLATTAGKVFLVVIAAVVVGTVVLCGALTVPMEFCPLKLTVEQDMLVAQQMREDYAVPLDSIEDLELVQQLPDLSRVNGTGMPNLSKGTYRDRDTGERCEVFLNPENSVFLKFTSDGTTYYMSAADDVQTAEVYHELS